MYNQFKEEVSFFTQCYDRDYQYVLNEKRILNTTQLIKLPYNIIINLCDNYMAVKEHCEILREKKLINNYFCVNEYLYDILEYFDLTESQFTCKLHYKICLYGMAALFFCKTQYLFFLTGDSIPTYMTNFIMDCLTHDKQTSELYTYTLNWADSLDHPRSQSYKEDEKFLYVKNFSDQNFLVHKNYLNIKKLLQEFNTIDYPHIDAFESRFSKYMSNNNISRAIYKEGNYKHQNFF